jgi:EpsI family protein
MMTMRKQIVVLGLMLATSGLAYALRPTELLAHRQAPVNLATLVPTAFGEWREEPRTQAMVVDPSQQATLDKIYQQTLSRTYINADGERVMLSLAYGEDQRDSMQVHYPEVCYPAQGFSLKSDATERLATGYGEVMVRRLMTTQGSRSEPVTYWIVIGDRAVLGGLASKLTQMRYGVHGMIPDGVLFRVSSLNADAREGYALQDRYVRSLMAALSPAARARLIGSPQS